MLYHQSVRKNFEDKERKKHISNLIRFFHSFFSLLIGPHYLIHLLFKQPFFRKKTSFFDHFQHGMFFLSTHFYSKHVIFSKYFFLKKTNKTFIFSIFHFLFKIKYHPISRKRQNEKSLFCLFFKNSKHFFLTSQKDFFES